MITALMAHFRLILFIKAIILPVHSCGVSFSVLIVTSGVSGGSCGAYILVIFVIAPCEAFLYNPFGSRLTQVSKEH